MSSAINLTEIARDLRYRLEAKKYLDVGRGASAILGLSQYKFQTVLSMLVNEQAAVVHTVKILRPAEGLGGFDKMVAYKVLAEPEVTWEEARDAVRNGELATVEPVIEQSPGALEVVVIKQHDPESMVGGPGVFRAVAASEDAAKRWIQDEVDGKHGQGHSYMSGKSADWWIERGHFSIPTVEVQG